MNGWRLGGAILIVAAVVGSASSRPRSGEQATSAPPVASPAAAPSPAASGPVALYAARCGVCHEGAGNPGYLALRQLGQAEPALSKRTDLDPDYVRTVVREGLAQMPPMTPSYVSDRELDAIAGYLARRK